MRDPTYDVVVVGAGPAGSTAAFVLARGGARVALVDKATFARDKACGDLIGPRGLGTLDDLELGPPDGREVGEMIVVGPSKYRVVLARYARHKRLNDACVMWAFSSITKSPGARAFYDQHRAAGDTHHRALRALANRLVGILHGCLAHVTPYDEHTAWGHRTEAAA